VALLDLLKRNRQDEEDEAENPEETLDSREDSEDGDSAGGLLCKLSMVYGLGTAARGMLGRVLKRGGDEDEADEAEDDDGPPTLVAAPEAGPVTSAGRTASPGQAVIKDSEAGNKAAAPAPEGPAPEGVKDSTAQVDLTPTEEAVASNEGDSKLGLGNIFPGVKEVNPRLKDLAQSQEDIRIEELAEELQDLLALLDPRH
jgi:hypothetical protein